MTAIINIDGKRAAIRDYKWMAADKELEGLLNAMLDPDGPGGDDPNPDETAAREAAKALGGRVVSVEPVESEEGVIY